MDCSRYKIVNALFIQAIQVRSIITVIKIITNRAFMPKMLQHIYGFLVPYKQDYNRGFSFPRP